MHVLGITGGICSGKSTATSLLSSADINRTVTVIDADKLGHQAYSSNTACFQKLRDHFGSEIIDAESGEINRKALGAIVFADPSKMRELQEIVWPEIRLLLQQQLEEYRSTGQFELVIVEAAIMIEAGWQDLVDTLWVVSVESELAKLRLMQRNSLSAEDAERRVASQLNNSERCRYAHYVIENNYNETDAASHNETSTGAFKTAIMRTYKKFEEERYCK